VAVGSVGTEGLGGTSVLTESVSIIGDGSPPPQAENTKANTKIKIQAFFIL
jgi:hypothetical protein